MSQELFFSRELARLSIINYNMNMVNPDQNQQAPKVVGEWVTLDMKLMDWSYMDFLRTVPADKTTLFTIKEVIKEWHGGRIASLTVFRDTIQEPNELRDEMNVLTLKECGINGSHDISRAPIVKIYYDFKPEGCTKSDPILMV